MFPQEMILARLHSLESFVIKKEGRIKLLSICLSRTIPWFYLRAFRTTWKRALLHWSTSAEELFMYIISVIFIVFGASFFTNSLYLKNGIFATILVGCAFELVNFRLILWTLLKLISFRTCMLSHINCLTVCLQFSKSTFSMS